MKKTLSIVLAEIMLVSSLAGCAGVTSSPAISSNIRVTSSDGADVAAWLDARLGDKLTDRIVLGTDADGYGVDVGALEDDGYFIRVLGSEIALFARTTNGLDRAVRKYATTVEAGKRVADVTYHEGARIENLILAGNDISTFALRVDSENDYVRKWVTGELAGYFADLIGMATGFTPVLGGEADHYIILRHVARDGWSESSYNYHFEDGDLVIEFVDLYGAKNGALMFLQEECGWVDLAIGYDVLEESDLIEIPASLNVTKHLTLPGGVDQSCLRSRYSSLRRVTGTLSDTTYKGASLTNRNYRIPSAHHALGTTWARAYGVDKTSHYVCLTNEYVFEDTVDEITAHIAARIDAGEKLGDSIDHIDLGMEDGNVAWGTTFCNCKDCYNVYVDEGAAWAGPMIRFANRVEEAVDEAGYDGIKYSVFAYVGSQMPPKKTAPNDDIYVTIVTHEMCDKHVIDGSECTGNAANMWMRNWNKSYTHGERTVVNNVDWAEWIKGWHALGAHVYMRVATLSAILRPYMTMYTQYENMKFFVENGVMAIYNETYAFDGIDFNHLVGELYQICQFYPDLTRDEYYAQFDRLLKKYYGDSWADIRQLCDLMRRAEICENCTSAWYNTAQYNDEFFLAYWDEMLSLADNAAKGAGSEQEERFCDYAKCIVIKMGCASTYRLFGAQSEEFAAVGERWEELVTLFEKHGHPIVDAASITSYHHGTHEGNVILFTADETGYWPSAIKIEPTLEAMDEDIQY